MRPFLSPAGLRAARLLGLGSIAVAAAVLYWVARPEFNGFVRSQWLFNYQAGFIRRGLPGQLVVLLPGQPQAAVHIAALSVLCALMCMLVWFTARATSALRGTARLTLPFFIATAPFAGGYFVLDFGRTDQLNLVLMMASLLVLWQGVSLPRLLLVALLAALGVLVHEGFVFMCVPLVLAVLVHQALSRRAPWLFALGYGAVALGALVITIILGHPRLPPIEQWQRMTGPDAPWDQLSGLAVTSAYRSIGENVRMTMGILLTRETLVQYALGGLYLMPALIVLRRLAYRIGAQLPETDRPLLGLMCAASLAPLLMTALGFDFFRWIAMALFNVMLALLFALRLAPSGSVMLTGRDERAVWAAALLYALVGPLDDRDAGHGPNWLLSLVQGWGA